MYKHMQKFIDTNYCNGSQKLTLKALDIGNGKRKTSLKTKAT